MDLLNWLLIFLRAGALLSVFPVFSAANFPAQLRVALAALTAFLIAPLVPLTVAGRGDLWGIVGLMSLEIVFGLLLGFVSRMLFYALEIAGGLVATEIGLMIPAGFNPLTPGSTSEISTLFQYLAAMLFLTLNGHHALLAAFQKSYQFLPIGGGAVRPQLLLDIMARTSHLFWFALQVAAPILAVCFILSLVFAFLGRAVPQMNVFAENFSVRLLAGLAAFGLTSQLMAQHIANFLRRLPEDVVRVAQLVGMQ